MTERSDKLLIGDMLMAIERILEYLDGVPDRESFFKDQMLIDAVTRNYEILGEASSKVSKEIKEEFPELPWRQMYGLRNFAAHEYHIIDARVLWEIAQEHLVTNKSDLEKVIRSLG